MNVVYCRNCWKVVMETRNLPGVDLRGLLNQHGFACPSCGEVRFFDMFERQVNPFHDRFDSDQHWLRCAREAVKRKLDHCSPNFAGVKEL